jgi:hypothetical protein
VKKSSKVLLENKLLDSWQLPVCGLHVTSLATGSRQEGNLNYIFCNHLLKIIYIPQNHVLFIYEAPNTKMQRIGTTTTSG